MGPAEGSQNIDGLLPKLNPRRMCVECLLGPNVWVRRTAGSSDGVVKMLERGALLCTEIANARDNIEPVREIERKSVSDANEGRKEGDLLGRL